MLSTTSHLPAPTYTRIAWGVFRECEYDVTTHKAISKAVLISPLFNNIDAAIRYAEEHKRLYISPLTVDFFNPLSV